MYLVVAILAIQRLSLKRNLLLINRRYGQVWGFSARKPPPTRTFLIIPSETSLNKIFFNRKNLFCKICEWKRQKMRFSSWSQQLRLVCKRRSSLTQHLLSKILKRMHLNTKKISRLRFKSKYIKSKRSLKLFMPIKGRKRAPLKVCYLITIKSTHNSIKLGRR